MEAAGGVESDEEGEDDDILKRSSFAAGEVYDADGNRVYDEDAGGSGGGGSGELGGGEDGDLMDTLVATQVRNGGRGVLVEEHKEQLS